MIEYFKTASALYEESDLCVPIKLRGLVPISTFMYSICEGFVYSQDMSAYLAAAK